jgi:hypothetical protein
MQRFALLILLTATLATAGASPALGATAPRVVNVTSDSAPGWIPTEEQERIALKTLNDFLAARDAGRARDAYALLADVPDREPFAAFSDELRRFNAQSGPAKEHRVLAVTWTKDPAQAPSPGVYAAIDLASQFANIDRDCGYVVVYQPPQGGDFRVMRREENYIDNASAQGSSNEQVEAVWSRLSANCPNYSQAVAPLAEAHQHTTGYPSVAAALKDLHSRPAVKFSVQNGWTVAVDDAERSIWSFPPQGHAAYPSAVRRQIREGKDGVTLDMAVQCEASKAACDDLVRTFQDLNTRMSTALQRKPAPR